MASLFNLLLFISYKALIVGIFYFTLQYFNIRLDILALYFYIFLSFFQLLYVIFQAFSGTGSKKDPSLRQFGVISQYTPIITILMEILMLSLSCYYLIKLENDLTSILLIFTSIIPIHTVYYYLNTVSFGFIIKKRNMKIGEVNIFSFFLFILIIFFEPAAYIFFKYFYSGTRKFPDLKILISGINMTGIDISLFTLTMLINGIVIFLFLYYKKNKAKSIYKIIGNLSLVNSPGEIRINDINEYGYIETGIRDLQKRLFSEKESFMLINDYVSKNMRDEIKKSGIVLEGEEKTAVVVTIRIGFYIYDYTPGKYIKLLNSIFNLIGEYAEEYEAYPFFQLNRAVIIYGVPYYYEHSKLNAIEATQEMITDIENLINNEGGTVSIHAGIYSGTVVTGALNTKGKGILEYSATGEGIEVSEKIAWAAENIDARILVSYDMIDGLKNKFYPDRTLKLKLINSGEILLAQLKV